MFYDIKCFKGQVECGSNIRYYPGRTTLMKTAVFVSNLKPYTSYKFQVVSKNGVTDVAGKANFKQIVLTTNESSES